MTDREKTVHCPICKRLFGTPQGLGMHLKHGCDLSEKKTFTLGKIPDREQLCREFTELTGGHWHEFTTKNWVTSCDVCHKIHSAEYTNPTYENPADVLRVIIEIGLYDEFMVQYGGLSKFGRHLDSILVDLILEPDALLKVAVDFLKEEKLGSP